jgi:hypothetical protein
MIVRVLDLGRSIAEGQAMQSLALMIVYILTAVVLQGIGF